MRKLVMLQVCLLVMVSGCAGLETRVDETVRGPQVKIGSYNIDISDDYKYLGMIPNNYMAKNGGFEQISGVNANVKIENHVFVKGDLVSEGILVQVYSLPADWHFRSEVDFDNVMFLKLIKFATSKGHTFDDKQYVYIMKQGRNSGRNKRFFVNYIRGFDNRPTEPGDDTFKSSNGAFTITK